MKDTPTFPLWPETASEWAQQVDYLHLFLTAHNVFWTLVVFLMVVSFAILYRRRSEYERPRPILGSKPLEIAFTIAPLLLWLGVFYWGATLYFDYAAMPKDAMEIYVVGKQWMFYTQHPEGQREINELHVPLGRPVKLTLSSEDVIHSFFIPAFRLKRDVIPGHYNQMWFTATKTGKYHLFCAEYCGTEHSAMGGWVYVLDPMEYDNWLSGVSGGGGMDSMASQGEKLFAQLGCSSCHRIDMQGRCPNLSGVFGKGVQLTTGTVVVADETYIRESVLNPGAKIVAGYQNIMPSFQGQVSEQNLLQLIAYIKSMANPSAGSSVGAGGSAGGVGQGVRIGQGAGGSVNNSTGQTSATSQGVRGTRDNKTMDRNLSAPQ